MTTDLITAARRGDRELVKELLDSSDNDEIQINATDEEYGQTAISWAAEYGYLDIVEDLWARGADIEKVDQNGHKPIYWAKERGRRDTVRFLLDHQKDFTPSEDGTLLHPAAVYGTPEQLERILGLSELKPDPRDGQGRTPLMCASEHSSSVDNVRVLLQAHADPLLVDVDGQTAMEFAANAQNLAALSLLSAAAIEMLKNNPDGDVSRVMFAAAKGGDTAAIRTLLKREPRPDVNQFNTDERTALYLAAENGHFDIVRELAAAGANVLQVGSLGENHPLTVLVITAVFDDEKWDGYMKTKPDLGTKESDGKTALMFAAQFGLDKLISRLLGAARSSDSKQPIDPKTTSGSKNVEDGKGAVDVKGLLSARDFEGKTPLMIAASFDREAAVKVLLENGADVTEGDSAYGQTALMWAAEKGHSKVIPCLAEAGAIEALSNSGKPAIIWAASNKRAKAVRALVKAGADVQAIDTRYRQSVLSWAAECGDCESVRVLIGAGADIYFAEDGWQSPIDRSWKSYLPVIEALIDCPRDDTIHPADKTPRPRVIALALRLSSEAGSSYADETAALWKLITDKKYLDAIDENDRSLLSWVAQRGTATELKELFQQSPNCDCNLPDKDGRTPLSWAAESGNITAVNLLFSKLKDEKSHDSRDKAGRSPLSWAAGSGELGAVKLLLAKREVEKNFDKGDENGRTPLSWAASAGALDVVKCLLLEKEAKATIADTQGRTPFFWAVDGGDKECVQFLLDQNVEPDRADGNRRTPLSWAAEKGHVEIVKILLRFRDEMQQLKKTQVVNRKTDLAKSSGGATGAETTVVVEINSRDNKNLWTPLWHAAMNQHTAVFDALLVSGADTTATDMSNKTLVEALEEKKNKEGLEAQAREDIESMRSKLIAKGSLWSKPPAGTAIVDKEFTATVLYVPKDEVYDLRLRTTDVEQLLQGKLPDAPPTNVDVAFTWMHLPANNMRWVEVLMARRYESCGDGEGWKSNVVLKSRLWDQQQHVPRDGSSYHARFMRSASHSFVLRETKEILSNPQERKSRDNKTKKDSRDVKRPGLESKDGKPSKQSGASKERKLDKEEGKRNVSQQRSKAMHQTSRGLVMFMPYLHWEVVSEQNKLKNIMEEKRALLRVQEDQKMPKDYIQKELEKKLSASKELGATEKLYWMYLDEDHPLHSRRTLDQFYYHTFPNTNDRDCDQTVIRYYENNKADLNSRGVKQPVLTMVDQLWMWVLPACGNTPPTILTAFPQRSDRSSSKMSMTALVSNILDRFRECTERSAEQLAHVIAGECSRVYFDTMSNRSELLQFLEVYTTSIGEITDRETRRFREFQNSIKMSSEKAARGLSDEDPKLLRDLLDIEKDIEDLRQIKDIRDELNIMSSVFHIQRGVIQGMDHIFREPKEKRVGFSGGGLRRVGTGSSFYAPATSLDGGMGGGMDDGMDGGYDQRMFHSPSLGIVERNIEEVVRLDRFAERAARAIEQLLDLKHKQANLLEEQLTRKLTRGIYKINDGTDRQGKTIMYFTVATIIFLPLSFMASFLTIDVDAFPRGDGDKLSLSFVLTIIFAVSVAVIIPSTFVAFNLDTTTRSQRMSDMRKSLSRTMDWWRRWTWPPTLERRRRQLRAKRMQDDLDTTTRLANMWRRKTWGPAKWWSRQWQKFKRHREKKGADRLSVRIRNAWRRLTWWWIQRHPKAKQPDPENGGGFGNKDTVDGSPDLPAADGGAGDGEKAALTGEEAREEIGEGQVDVDSKMEKTAMRVDEAAVDSDGEGEGRAKSDVSNAPEDADGEGQADTEGNQEDGTADATR